MLMENAVRHAKDVLITFLQLYFNNPDHYAVKLPARLRPEAFANIVFYDAEPEELRSLPAVIITNASGSMVTAGLGDMATEIRDPRTDAVYAYQYQGFYELSFDVYIGCRTPLEREVLGDFVAKALRFDLRRFIQNNGVLIKDLSYGGEATVDYDSDKIYTSSLRVNTWSNWVEDRPLLDPDEFNIRVTMRTAGDAPGTSTVVSDGMDRLLDHGDRDVNDPNNPVNHRLASGAPRSDEG